MKQAVHHWVAQRLTAVILVPFCLWFIFTLANMSGMDHATVNTWIKSPWHSVLLILFILMLFYHAQLGLQVVVEDYISNENLRNNSIILCKIAMLLAGLVSILSVLKIALGL